jgi:hypothetical protein
MNLENVRFLGLCCLIILNCTVQKKHTKIIIGLIATKRRHLSKLYCSYLK